MSDVPPDDRPRGSGWQPPSGGYPQQGGGSGPPPAGAGWQQQPPSQPPPAGDYQPPGYGYQQQSGPAGPGGQPLAEWWKRLLAILLDFVILVVPLFIIFFVFIGVSVNRTIEVDPITGEITRGGGLVSGGSIAFSVVTVVVASVYYALLNGSARGQTVGKMALGIRVVDADGRGPIGIGRGFVRSVIAVLPAQVPFVGVVWALIDNLWPLWDPRRQALHDKAANSLVVNA